MHPIRSLCRYLGSYGFAARAPARTHSSAVQSKTIGVITATVLGQFPPSARRSTSLPRTCSGDAYAAVPTVALAGLPEVLHQHQVVAAPLSPSLSRMRQWEMVLPTMTVPLQTV